MIAARLLYAAAMAWMLAAPAAVADDGFATFHAGFRAAMARPDGDATDVADAVEAADAVIALTRLPFLFEGRDHDAAGFRRAVWPVLFTPPLRRCWARARALAEPDAPAGRSLHCAPYALHFDAAGGRWQLREFSVEVGQ